MKPSIWDYYRLAGLELPSGIEDTEFLTCAGNDTKTNRFDLFLDSDYIHLGLAEIHGEDLLDLEAVRNVLEERFYNNELAKLFFDFHFKTEDRVKRYEDAVYFFLNKEVLKSLSNFPVEQGKTEFMGLFLPEYHNFLLLKEARKGDSATTNAGKGFLSYEFTAKPDLILKIKNKHGFTDEGYIALIKHCADKFQKECLSIFDYFTKLMELEKRGAISLSDSCGGVFDNFRYYVNRHGKENVLKKIKDEISLYYFKSVHLHALLRYSDKHFYIVGSTGSGKSELLKYLFAQEHLKQKRNAILIDPHGDLSEQIVKARFINNPRKERNLIYVDTDFNNTIVKAFRGEVPNDIFKENNSFSDLPRINPLELPEKYTNNTRVIENTAKNILNAFNEIITSDRDNSDKAFSLNMETLLIPCLSALLRRPNSTLEDLQDFMDDDINKPLVDFGIKHCSDGQKRFFQKGFYSKQLEKTKHAISMKLQSLFNSELFVKMMCGKSTIDLEKAQKEDCRIIFRLDKKTTGDMQQALGVFITTSILNASYRLTESQRRGTYFIIDEFQNFVTDSIEDVLSQSRKYGLFLTLAHQHTPQIRNSKVKASISANTDIKILGRSEKDTHTFFDKKASLSTELKEKAKQLKAGQFFLFNGMNNGTLVKAPSVLIKTESLNKHEWRNFLLSQYEKYYKTQPQKEADKKKVENKEIKYVNF